MEGKRKKKGGEERGTRQREAEGERRERKEEERKFALL